MHKKKNAGCLAEEPHGGARKKVSLNVKTLSHFYYKKI
jgi:hypothetical protein